MGNTEILDIFNGQGHLIGIRDRESVHRDGDWHKTFHCWIIYRDIDNIDYVVLQKRSENKNSWPGFIDITAAGHLSSGEIINDGIREVEEELGIEVDFNRLINVGIRVCIDEFKEGFKNHEFQNIFFLIEDKDISEYKIQIEELSGLLKVKIDDLLLLFSNQLHSINSNGFIVEPDGNRMNTSIEITKEYFIPTLDNYYYKIMILAKRLLNKEKHLQI